MDADTSRLLRRLLDERPVAALGTLHRGEPAVSMVPFVLPPGDDAPVIHISALAPHTRDLRQSPAAGLLVCADPAGPWPAQALPRVSLQVRAQFLEPGTAQAEAAGAQYRARFPDAAITFGLADFSLVRLAPVSARLVAGFGRAHALAGAALAHWLRAPAG